MAGGVTVANLLRHQRVNGSVASLATAASQGWADIVVNLTGRLIDSPPASDGAQHENSTEWAHTWCAFWRG